MKEEWLVCRVNLEKKWEYEQMCTEESMTQYTTKRKKCEYGEGIMIRKYRPSQLWLVLRVYCLVGLVVKASALGAEDPGFESRLQRDFSRSSHTNDLKIETPVATLPGTWHYRVSTGTGRPSVSILWLGEVDSLICNFYLSVAAHKIVCADPYRRYTSMLLGR